MQFFNRNALIAVLSTAVLTTASAGAATFKSDDLGFAVAFPCQPQVWAIPGRDLMMKGATYGCSAGKTVLTLTATQWIGADAAAKAMADAKKEKGIGTVTMPKKVTVGAVPGIEASFAVGGSLFRTRFFLYEERFYQLEAEIPIAEASAKTVDDFFASLAIAKVAGASVKYAHAPIAAGEAHVCASFYPRESLSAHEEGTTTVSFVINAQGKVEHPVAVTSSGHPKLDDAATTCIATWRYVPAGDDKGNAIAVPWRVTVMWTMPGKK